MTITFALLLLLAGFLAGVLTQFGGELFIGYLQNKQALRKLEAKIANQ